MKQQIHVLVSALLCTWIAQAEQRTFTNTDGQAIEAELIAVAGTDAVLKLANGSTAKVPLTSLSKDDQSFAKSWWEENKNKLSGMDVRLKIDKNTKRLDRQVSKPKGGGKDKKGNQGSSKVTKDEYTFTCTLKSYLARDVSDITATYTIYKRTSSRDKDGSKTTTSEIDGSASIKLLEALGTATFDTQSVECEDSSQKGGKGGGSSRKSETIEGIVVTLSAGGADFLKQSYPENHIKRLQEEEKRQEKRDN